MFSSFSRPKGAAIDVKELEYISALHQSQTSPLRTNGTISSMDIQLFLKSRYGIDVTEEDALDILRGLGGTSASATTTATAATGAATVTRGRRSCCSSAAMDDQSKEEEEEEEEEYLDIAQLTSILLIPTLLKACHDIISIHNNNNNNNNNDIHETMKNTIQHANNQITSIQTKLSSSSSKTFCTYWKLQKDIVKWKHVIQEVQHVQEHTPNPRWIVRDVLRILLAPLHDDCGDDDDDDEYKLTIQSLQTLLITHGEEDMAKNIPLLQSMIDSCAAATLPGRKKDDEKEVVLHKVSFAKALSFDLQTWNIGCEDNQRTNTYHDVFLKDYYNDFEELDDIFFQKRNNDDENADGGGGGGGGGYRFAKLYLNAIIMRGGMNKDARNVDDNGAGANQQCMMKERTSQDETHVESSSDVETAIIHEEEETEETSALFQDVPTTITNNEKEISFSCHDDDDDDDNLKTSTSSTTDDTINDLTTTTTTTTTKNPNHVKTAPYIDYVVDSYRSLTFLMSLWIFYLITLLLFSNIVGRVEREAYCDTPTFSCNLVRDLITWITIAILLSVGGLVIIVPISIANDSSKKSPYIVTFSFVLLALYTFIPYKYIMKYRTHIPHDAPGGGNSTELKRFIQSDFALVITTIFLAFGCIMLFMMAILFVITFVPYEFVANHHPTTWTFWDMLLPSHFTSTANVKLAGTHKVNELLQNAIQMHQLPPDDDTHEHDGSIDDDDDDDESAAAVVHDRRQPVNAIQNFVLNGEHEEQCGGFIWTWKRIFTKELTRKDGIWLHSRLAIGQMGQIISLGLYVTLLSWLAHSLAEDARNARARIIADWRLPDDWESWALNIVPTPSMIYSAFIPGAVIAFISGILLISVYVPSTVSTVLKLRCGLIQTLKNDNFNSYRSSADSTFYNIGGMIYALLGSFVLMFVLFAGLIFLFVWPVTAHFMMLVLSWCLGLCITIGIKTVMLMFCRANFQSAFFRKNPRSANYSALAMECWNIGLGGGVMIGRLTQFLFASAFWIGRIDVQFLDENVSLFGYSFDYTPINYRKEILVHEAHRHPFMERLGAMYLMRLRHGRNFSCDAGACWRILFVKGLMPWLEKYREFGRSRQDENDSPTIHED